MALTVRDFGFLPLSPPQLECNVGVVRVLDLVHTTLNRVWHAIQGGEVGAWVGIYNEAKDEIEEAEEPLYEDE